jgi:hypothetical protein
VPTPELIRKISHRFNKCSGTSLRRSFPIVCLSSFRLLFVSGGCHKPAAANVTMDSNAGGTSGIGHVADLTTARNCLSSDLHRKYRSRGRRDN